MKRTTINYSIGIIGWILTGIVFFTPYPYYMLLPFTLGIGCYPVFMERSKITSVSKKPTLDKSKGT
jgi:hypothetical protein